FAIGVHGLKHDGKLFRTKEIFSERAPRINAYLEKWGTKGFTTPSMLRNHEWMLELNIDFCVSTFDTDPFEPVPEGVGTIFPFWVRSKTSDREFLELPYTLVQDFTLFVILSEKTNSLWKEKLDWIAQNGGMALLNTHPDYMNFDGQELLDEEYPVALYIEFLQYIKSAYAGKYFPAVPSEIAAYLKQA
ncbi:MAG TPA: hypothetical protein DGG95_12205, partial [Cytophagales bacterium]|nr:hypothetical protein [Cytophagales bacterium]